MTDQTPEPTESPDPVALPPAFTPEADNFLTLDQIMTSARRSRRIARICLAADLEAEYLAVLDELATLVTADGELVAEDASMEEVGKVTALREKAADLRDRMAAKTRPVLFEAMDSDAWEAFEKIHRGPDGKIKDATIWQNELISACAINPTFKVEDVQAIRKKLSPSQFQELANQSYSACTSGGVDVPKLPGYWHSPKPQESSLS
jgi:hypothetical protein